MVRRSIFWRLFKGDKSEQVLLVGCGVPGESRVNIYKAVFCHQCTSKGQQQIFQYVMSVMRDGGLNVFCPAADFFMIH